MVFGVPAPSNKGFPSLRHSRSEEGHSLATECSSPRNTDRCMKGNQTEIAVLETATLSSVCLFLEREPNRTAHRISLLFLKGTPNRNRRPYVPFKGEPSETPHGVWFLGTWKSPWLRRPTGTHPKRVCKAETVENQGKPPGPRARGWKGRRHCDRLAVGAIPNKPTSFGDDKRYLRNQG